MESDKVKKRFTRNEFKFMHKRIIDSIAKLLINKSKQKRLQTKSKNDFNETGATIIE